MEEEGAESSEPDSVDPIRILTVRGGNITAEVLADLSQVFACFMLPCLFENLFRILYQTRFFFFKKIKPLFPNEFDMKKRMNCLFSYFTPGKSFVRTSYVSSTQSNIGILGSWSFSFNIFFFHLICIHFRNVLMLG
jgi:hypothetical protein